MERQQLTEQFLFCCIQNKKPRNQFTFDGFVENQAGVQLFFWEKTVGNGDYKVMSKINPLINLMFFDQNNTVFGIQ
jgi:hypothetical protein